MNIPAYNKSSSQEDFDFVEQQIVPFLPNVKSLLVHGGFTTEKTQQTWKLVQACIQNMRRLNILELHREAGGLVVADLKRPSLKKLRVGGVVRSDSVSCLGDFKVHGSLCSAVSSAFFVSTGSVGSFFFSPADPELLNPQGYQSNNIKSSYLTTTTARRHWKSFLVGQKPFPALDSRLSVTMSTT
jgi:hypothetical protein